MRKSLSRVIGNSLAALHGPNVDGSKSEARLDERREQIKLINNVVLRDVALTVHDLTVDDPQKAEKWRRRLGGAPADFIGAGDFAAVYTTPDMPTYVQKFYRRLVDKPDEQKRVLEHKMDMSARLFGTMALATKLGVGTDPLTEIRMPVGVQKFCSYGPEDTAFPDLNTRDMLAEYYESLEDRHPGSTSAILAFCVQAQTTWIRNGVIPDIFRPENAVIGSVDSQPAELYLIDTVPHSLAEPQYSQVHAQILDKISLATTAL